MSTNPIWTNTNYLIWFFINRHRISKTSYFKRIQMRKEYPIGDLIKDFGKKCYHCGVIVSYPKAKGVLSDCSATRDHLVPLSIGGENSKDNIVLSCRKCNNNRQ